jgi:serine/threonine protein kinase/Flp pilus assembly protein TadD
MGANWLLGDEIQRRLWPNDTIVDFENGINTAIRRLRQALGDSADQPKYIETIPRRGYRLMVPVEWVEQLPVASGQLPKSEHAAAVRMQPETGSLISKKVSHYRVLEVIGGGGMGMVYKAEDLKLGRQVALKFLPEELASDPVALQRFEREAQTASSLNHPNICTIHEVEEYEGQPFIVMELLEGETLRDRLASLAATQNKLALDQLLDTAIQICEGLQAAHAKGIIHRDIKPANIFLTSSGQVKILDFGLAKLVEAGEKEPTPDGVIPSAERSEASRDPYNSDDVDGIGVPRLLGRPPSRTTSSLGMTHENDALNGPAEAAPRHPVTPAEHTLTRTGLAMGTSGYMSPEQVRAETLDARTDIFSFGLVLYEMATGQRAFSGATAAVVENAILNEPPLPARELNPALPPRFITTIDKALEKDREQRYQSASEMRAAFGHLRSETARDRFGDEGTKVREAYLLHVKAMYWAGKGTPDALQKAFRYAQQAIEADPVYAEAYGDLAYLFALMGQHGPASPMDMFPKARAAAERALKIDETVAKAHAALGFTRLVFDWDFAGAESEIRCAMELDPNFAGGNYAYSLWYLSQGLFEQAIQAAKRAIEMDPLALPGNFNLGAIYLYARCYPEAIEHLRKMRELDPTFSEIHSVLALAYARNGMYQEAIAAATPSTNEARNKIRLGIVSAIVGREDVARSVLEELRLQGNASPQLAYRLAGIPAQLGDLDDAFEYLSQALVGRAGLMAFVKVDPGFDNLHSDARWLGLLRRVGPVAD